MQARTLFTNSEFIYPYLFEKSHFNLTINLLLLYISLKKYILLKPILTSY